MSVKIIIDRKFKKVPVPENFQIINMIRRGALLQKGYVSGETLVNFEDNHVVVVSTWASLVDWQNWLDNQDRANLEIGLSRFQREPSKIRCFITGADYAKEAFA